ncbi:hypothetical protein MKEN_01105000 [Mycena kentingensis (nom. inval.)]|nr:hypothetical protein MKEN_01105000 [Mycena kentingensis (nom. inval.)]
MNAINAGYPHNPWTFYDFSNISLVRVDMFEIVMEWLRASGRLPGQASALDDLERLVNGHLGDASSLRARFEDLDLGSGLEANAKARPSLEPATNDWGYTDDDWNAPASDAPTPTPMPPTFPTDPFFTTRPSYILRILPTLPTTDGDSGRPLERHELAEIDLDELVPRTAVDDYWGIEYPSVDAGMQRWVHYPCHGNGVPFPVLVYTRFVRDGEQAGVVYEPEDAQL